MAAPSEPSRQPSPPAPHQRWFAELKRRKVFRVIAVYGAVSFVVLEAADVIFPAIPLPAWTVSLVLYLLLLGFPIAVVLAWAFEMTPEGVQRTVSAAPAEIDAIVAAPARTRWPAGLLAVGGLILLAVAFYGGRRSASRSVGEAAAPAVESTAEPDPAYLDLADDPRPAIAVLPFDDMSAQGDQEYFSDGISEEIRTVLSRIRDLRVAARSSAFAYKGRDLDPRQVGAELGVPFLLDGTVRKDGNQLRITAELVSVSDGFPLWSQTYNRRLENIFVIQTEIAEAITEALRVPLGLSREALVSTTLDMDAHDLYLSGRAAMRRRGPGVGEAVRLFEASVARDSTWGPAWAALAEAHAINPLYTGLGGESKDSTVWARSLAAAEAAARRALDLDPRNASAHVALGGVHRDRWEWDEGETALRQALQLDPDSEEAHVQYAELLWGMGRLDESLRETGRALSLDRSPLTLDIHGFALFMNGRAEEAERVLEEGIVMDSAGDMHFLRTVLANLMLFDGRYQVAIDRFASYLPDPVGFRMLGEALEAGDPTLMPEVAGRGWAQTWMSLGEPERALDALEASVHELPFRVQYEIWDPVLAPIWATPRFRNVILPRVRLEGAEVRRAPPPEGR